MEIEKSRFAVNGGIKMPIGYRFHPTDDELVIHYLRPKVLAIPLPASVIPQFDVFQTDPWGLPGDLNEKKRYFFCNHRRRATSSGYWKPLVKHKLIVAPQTNQPVAIRKTLVFCQNKHVRGTKTRWFMHEFHLLGTQMVSHMELQDWVVYRLFQKKRKLKKQILKPKSIESSSCSSGVTDQEDSSNEVALLDDQEASSAYVFASFSCMRDQH